MVEHPRCRRIPAGRDIGAGLLVQPPSGKTEFGGYRQRFVVDYAVWLEQRVNVPGGPPRVVGEGHRSTAKYVKIGHDASSGEPVSQEAEGVLDARPVEQW